MAKVTIDIVSDVICPWCWVGKRNLDTAIKQSGRPLSDFLITWKPFQLRPATPIEGIEKAPNTEDNPRVGHGLKTAGKAVGIDFTGKTDKAPNTLKAHTLLKFASNIQEENKNHIQHELSEVLFRKYFTDGVFVGDLSELQEAAREVGLDVDAATAFMESEEESNAVSKEAQENKLKGVTGVPSFFINGKSVFSGVQPPEMFLKYF